MLKRTQARLVTNSNQLAIKTYFLQMKDCPENYKEWLVTMYTRFGNKWAKLHRGPMWEGDIIEQSEIPTGSEGSSLVHELNVPTISLGINWWALST